VRLTGRTLPLATSRPWRPDLTILARLRAAVGLLSCARFEANPW